MNIVAVSGSLRKGSYNTALLRAAQKLAPDLNIEILNYDAVPVFNQDFEQAAFPQIVRDLRAKIVTADGVLLAVPEFNRTIAAPLKNFLDWSSRPETEPSPWLQKPVGVLGASSGPRGASFAQYDVRRVMGYFNASVLNQPEFYLGNNKDKFDTDLNLIDERTLESLQKFLSVFIEFVQHAQKA